MTDPQYMTKIFIDTTKRKKVIFIKVAERQGKKLGDWVMDVLTEHLKAQFIDAAMKFGISFSALELKRREDGWVEVNPDTMHELCRLAKIPPHYYDLSSEEDLADIVFSLYAEWKKQGGTPDAVAEAILEESGVHLAPENKEESRQALG